MCYAIILAFSEELRALKADLILLREPLGHGEIGVESYLDFEIASEKEKRERESGKWRQAWR